MPKTEVAELKKTPEEALEDLKQKQKEKKNKGGKLTIEEIEARLGALEKIVLQAGGYR